MKTKNIRKKIKEKKIRFKKIRFKKIKNKILEAEAVKFLYIVIMYRWADKRNDKYILGVFNNKQQSILEAIKEQESRGGIKYCPEIIRLPLNNIDEKNIKTVVSLEFEKLSYNQYYNNKLFENANYNKDNKGIYYLLYDNIDCNPIYRNYYYYPLKILGIYDNIKIAIKQLKIYRKRYNKSGFCPNIKKIFIE